MSRDAEMGWILAKLKRPEPAAFVLAGAPGVGKTRLAAEAAKSAAGLGFTTAQAVASRAAAAIPFGPFAPFLPKAGYSPGDRLGLLRKASDAILDRAGPDRRLLLVVDDAQFLDEGSAALVHQLVRKGACSVLASVRTPGPAPEPVTALWKDGLAGHALEALGVCLLAAEAYLAAAAAYRSDGYARPASALTRRAGELAALCGDVSTPGLSFGTQTERLTRREREVAGMAAAGASSREIAAKLVLSVRTVDNHLQNAYSKLGMTSREELARVLRS
jgi:DNA-binding CsgD family transcriptional regulator